MSAHGSKRPGASARGRASRAFDRILDSRSPAGRFLDELALDDDRDRRLARELVLGTLRWLRRVDWVIESAARRPVGEIDREILTPLRLGVYQLLFLDRVPAHAAVDEAVRDARSRGCRRGAEGLVNAVMRRVSERRGLEAWPVEHRDPVVRAAIEESHPDFLVERWVERLGVERTRDLLAANNRRRPPQLLCLEEPADVERELERRGLRVERSGLAPRGLSVLEGDPIATPEFERGAVYFQDVASQAAALVPLPSPGERVLDAAAAPGGKSFSLLATERSVRLTAIDRSPARIGTLRANQRRLHRREPVIVADASVPPFGARFDRVMADLPCSGTGTLARHPELKWRISQSELARLADDGLRLLGGLADCVRPGGLLIAITCSIEPEENDGVIARLRERRPDLSPVPLDGRLAPGSAPYVAGEGKWQVLPANGNDGFTVHVLQRASTAPAV